ncbi:MAG: molybdopterin-dependent oxidoreductase [bacterium]
MPVAAETTGVQQVTLSLNGREIQALPGKTILEVAREAGVDIPTLCHDPRLEPYGACRLCLVEVEGARGPMAACGTAIREGMSIQTHSEKILKLRKFVLELLLTNHPLDCPVCEAAGDCRLQDYAYEYLVDMVPWGWRAPLAGDPGQHPNVAHFGARCILCGRCVRICREVMSIGCWGYLNRGYESEVDTPHRLPLQEVGCVSCGQCVSTCPVGSVTGQRTPQGVREWQTDKTPTTCSYCANGCRLVLHSYRGKVVRVASELQKGLNAGNLCVKGRFGIGYANAPDRLTTPLVRNAEGRLEAASWEQALQRVVEKATAVRAERGGQAVAAVCGTHCTNEGAYLLQKLVRTLLGSNNIDSIDHGEQAASEEALVAAFGLAAATNSRRDLAEADVIVVLGANLTESDPVLALDVVKALRKGKTVIVIDPRTTELAGRAQLHLAVKPGTDLAALRGMLRYIIDLGLQDEGFISSRTEGFASLQASLEGVDVAAEAAACGVDPELLRAAAVAYGQAGAAAILYGPSLVQGPNGVAAVRAVADLALLTGNIGRPGTGLYPLRSGANSQGLSDMGVRPDRLPGGSALTDAAAVARAEAAWGAGVSGAAGRSVARILDAVEAGEVGFLYVVGADPALALVDEIRVRKALEGMDFLVVQESFLSDTAAYADVVLPAAVASEDEGTFTNSERFVQRVRPAVPALGGSLPDWKIIQELANKLGGDWGYATPADVMREIAEVVPAYKGISYSRLEEEGLQWPCPGVDHPGTAILHATEFSGGRGAFAPVEHAVAAAGTDADYPFGLLTGSVREHHGTGVRSRRSPGLTQLVEEARLEINPGDAERLRIKTGDAVKVVSRSQAAIELPAWVTGRVPEGVLFAPAFSPQAPVTRLLEGDAKGVAAVKVERLA